jgi:hypothetical protein
VSDRWEFAARLAALHDRELAERDDADDAESEAVRQELASADDDALAAYADAVAIAREHREEDAAAAAAAVQAAAKSEPTVPGATPVTPLRPPERARGWRRPPARWLALAAVLAAVALIPFLRRAGSDDPRDAVALLQAQGAALPAGWDSHPWSRTRGGGDGLTDDARAVRLGTLMVDLNVAYTAGDTAAVQLLADRIGFYLESVPGSGPLASIYRRLETNAAKVGNAEVERLMTEAWEQLPRTVGEKMVRLGAWTEAARIAATRRDADFFRDRRARTVLDHAADDSMLPKPARGAAARAATAAEGAPDWNALRDDLDVLLRVIGS